MQTSTTETTSSTSTPSNAGADAAPGSTGANNFFWILPFTIACAIIYWYLTKRRDVPNEITIQASDIPKSKAKGETLSGQDHSVTDESNDNTKDPRRPKQKSSKKTKNKKKPVAKPQPQVSANQPNSGGLSKRERKMLAARLTPLDVAPPSVAKQSVDSNMDSTTNEVATAQPVKAIFEPIRVATAAKPDVETEQPAKVEPQRETPIEVASKPANKSGVFVPQKRELLVADRNANRWGTVEPSATAFVPQQHVQANRESSHPVTNSEDNSAELEQTATSQASSRSGLKNFVSKVRAKSNSDT